MMKMKGLDKLSRTLDEARRALAELDGVLGEVSFDPGDPASIEAAIQMAGAMVDEKMAPYLGNSLVQPLVEQLKETYRQSIIERAAAARLDGKTLNGN